MIKIGSFLAAILFAAPALAFPVKFQPIIAGGPGEMSANYVIEVAKTGKRVIDRTRARLVIRKPIVIPDPHPIYAFADFEEYNLEYRAEELATLVAATPKMKIIRHWFKRSFSIAGIEKYIGGMARSVCDTNGISMSNFNGNIWMDATAFAHEVGHDLGCYHDNSVDEITLMNAGPLAYARDNNVVPRISGKSRNEIHQCLGI